MRRKIWLTAIHIPGIQNTTADKLSRKFQDRTDWQLKPNVFNLLIERWGKPEIDLFASRHNYQFKPFVSWHVDPDAYATDATRSSTCCITISATTTETGDPLSKRQSPTTVLFRTTLTQTITQYELLILLGSNHLLCYVHLDDRANDLRTTTSVR